MPVRMGGVAHGGSKAACSRVHARLSKARHAPPAHTDQPMPCRWLSNTHAKGQ